MEIKTTLKYKGRTYKSLKPIFTEKVGLMKLKFFRELADNIGQWIVGDFISKGKSPVKYQRDYVEYSESYKTQIKNKWSTRYGKQERPVNLKLTGALHDSFYVRRRQGGGIEIGFSDVKASYHNEGGGNLPRRAMLPSKKGDSLKTEILNRIKKLLMKAAKTQFKSR